MEPTAIVTSLLTGIIANFTTEGLYKVVSKRPSMPTARVVAKVVGRNGETLTLLSEHQVEELRTLFASTSISHLTGLYVIAKSLPISSSDEAASIEEEINDIIKNDPISGIEIDVVYLYWSMSASVLLSAIGKQKIEQFLSGYVNDEVPLTDLQLTKASLEAQAMEDCVGKLRNLVTDQYRMNQMTSISRRVRRLTLENYRRMSLDHAPEFEGQRTFDELYVNRKIRQNGIQYNASNALGPERVVRAVVTGYPGGGKSTLMQHLMLSKCQMTDSAEVPVFLRLRDISEIDGLMTRSIRNALEAETQSSEISTTIIEDLISSGNIFVIFDGLDEISNLAIRRRTVERISKFATANPLASIVITSRKVGYSDAPFDSDRFKHYFLDEFTAEEVGEYTSKWFSGTMAKLRSSFLREVDELDEIIKNPLMLSLLCTLFKTSGTIPRKRWMVYKKCADLLFNRWDSMRQIDFAPEEQIDHGEYLMQDLAYFFYNSPSARGGVSEFQLRDVIAKYLLNNSPALEPRAKKQAEAFLAFCSGRAWLLAKNGNSSTGEPLFEFVHQTFMEFFAAEFIAREDRSSDELAKLIIEEFQSNKGSVLMDLLIASLNHSRRPVVGRILQSIDRLSQNYSARIRCQFSVLKLRIISSASVNATILDSVIAGALNDMVSLACGMAVKDAIFALPSDLSDRVVAMLMGTDGVNIDRLNLSLPELRVAFVEAYRLDEEFSDGHELNDGWLGRVSEVESMLSTEERSSSAMLRFLDIQSGDPTSMIAHDGSAIVRVKGSVKVHGACWETATKLLQSEPLNAVDLALIEMFNSGRVSTRIFASERNFAFSAIAKFLDLCSGWAESTSSNQASKFLLWLRLLSCEILLAGPSDELYRLEALGDSYVVATRARMNCDQPDGEADNAYLPGDGDLDYEDLCELDGGVGDVSDFLLSRGFVFNSEVDLIDLWLNRKFNLIENDT